MRRVCNQRQGDLFTGGSGADVICTEMIFDITSRPISIFITRKFIEDTFDWFANDICEDVETATMRHADSNVLYAIVDRAIDERLHSRNKCFTSLETEAFLIRVFAGNELSNDSDQMRRSRIMRFSSTV